MSGEKVSMKEVENEYKKYLLTDDGKEWCDKCSKRDIKSGGCFADYLYDFYPELLM